ncbi:hypothetical protein niasHT_033724 [Heterodera trifolii]|uniref:BTB domain-containing protein n=1 Tax=Heterodera trifolii TaxID=157864 RepID=A0ABD2I9F3_9BILA
MEIFDDFIVVDEKAFTNISVYRAASYCRKCSFTAFHDNSTFYEVTQFASLEFQTDHFNKTLQINDIGNALESDVPLAQIVVWGWYSSARQVIKQTEVLKMGGKFQFDFSVAYSSFSVVIRILKKREKDGDRNPFPSLSSMDDDLTVQIGDKTITVSASRLMAQSPMIHGMLNTEMREKQQKSLTLNELDINMEQFIEFLEAIPTSNVQTPTFPNPNNVLMLLKLADFFQVNWLKKRCETHLINCVEIPLIDRFLLSDQFGLDHLKNYFLRLNTCNLRAFFKSNQEKLSSFANKEFLAEFVFKLAD